MHSYLISSILKLMGRSTASKYIYKDGLIYHLGKKMVVQIKSDISCESSAGQCWRELGLAVL